MKWKELKPGDIVRREGWNYVYEILKVSPLNRGVIKSEGMIVPTKEQTNGLKTAGYW